MQNPRQLLEALVRVEQQLSGDPPYFLTSVDNPNTAGGVVGGRIFDLPDKREAARLVANGTHRIATADEIEQFYANLKRQGDDLALDAMSRKQQFAMPPEMKDLLAALGKQQPSMTPEILAQLAAEIIRQQGEKTKKEKP